MTEIVHINRAAPSEKFSPAPGMMNHVKDTVIALNKAVLALCEILDHTDGIPIERRVLIREAFVTAKVALWDLSDTLHLSAAELSRRMDD